MLPAVVAVVTGLFVFWASIKYGLIMLNDWEWREERAETRALEARRWGGDGTS